MEEAKDAAEAEFEHISGMAKQEVKHAPMCVHATPLSAAWMHVLCPPQIARLQAARVEMLQQALVQWCERQLVTAKDSADHFNKHLQVFRGMAE